MSPSAPTGQAKMKGTKKMSDVAVFSGLFGNRAIGTAAWVYDTVADIAGDIVWLPVGYSDAMVAGAKHFLSTVGVDSSDSTILSEARAFYALLCGESGNHVAFVKPAVGCAIGCYRG